MAHARFLSALVLCIFVLTGCTSGPGSGEKAAKDDRAPVLMEGFYASCEEYFFEWEVLKLESGRFQYWHWSDVITGNEPKYPLSGVYRVEGSLLILEHSHSAPLPKTRIIKRINGFTVLVKPDYLEFGDRIAPGLNHALVHAPGNDLYSIQRVSIDQIRAK